MPSEPMVGTEFAGYRLNAVISRTNMSVVYTAEHPRLGHAIALWTHMRNNGQLQTDHYDTLVVATTSNSGTLPSDLRDFWRFIGTLRTPIGKSLDSSALPPLTA
jgi:hypothetical protein